MKPSNVYLIRHGQSFSNVDLQIHATVPDFKIELTDFGKIQAMDAGAKIKDILDVYGMNVNSIGFMNPKIAVYNSPFYRTRQTAQLIKQSIAPYVVREVEDVRLREQEYGHLRDIDEANDIERRREEYGKFYFRIPDGESCGDVVDRQAAFLETLYRDFQDEDFPDNVLVVGHGCSIRCLLMKWLHWTVEEFESKRNLNNCEILRLELNNDGKYELTEEFV
jgi:broad specificity phosphatase PhoE